MAQLIILLIAFCLIGLVTARTLRARRPLPPLPQVEPLPPEKLRKRLASLALGQSLDHPALPRCSGGPRLLRRLTRQDAPLAALTYLQDHSRELLLPLMSMPKRVPPRMLGPCQQYLLSGGGLDPDALLAALEAMEPAGLSLAERQRLPDCLRACLCCQLTDVLLLLDRALHDARLGRHLALRMTRARRPMTLLSNKQLSPAAAHALLTTLRDAQQHTLLLALEEQLRPAAETHVHQQAELTDHLARINVCLHALATLDWPALSESTDPLHRLLAQDPTATYPAMDASSRSLYRQRAADLARLFRVEETHLVSSILELCAQADPDGLMDHVGWYLLEPAGMRALRLHLGTRHGGLCLFLRNHENALYRIGLSFTALAAALIFLHSGHPLFMVPVYLGVAACLFHFLGDNLRRTTPLPRMAFTTIPEAARTLIVIPAQIADRSQAVPMVRRLLLARKAFPEGAVDCLLLADYAPCITRTSSADTAIQDAARAAIDAVDGDGGRFLYLHRSRAWDASQRIYAGRDGKRGALNAVDRLIVHGECTDEFDAATVPPSFFHRRYAYVLTLDSTTTPAPDALLPLMGALAHPLNERRHTPDGLRGYSIIKPQLMVDPETIRSRITLWEGDDPLHGYNGQGLHRPDHLLEATDEWPLPSDLIEGELAGCCQTDATFHESRPATLAGWLHRTHRQTRSTWQLLPWLLPHVKTSQGVQRNPLSSRSRWQLRQHLRRSLIPACRLLLLLYAVLCRSWWLLLLALIAPALPFRPGRFLARLAELPLRAVIRGDAMLRAFLTKLPAAPEASSLSAWENWSQFAAVLLFAAASLLMQPLSVPGVLLTALFAAFPLMHPHLDAPVHVLPRPTKEAELTLMAAGEATWRYFEETVTADTHHLPPESLQVKPPRGVAPRTGPAACGLYLLSCLAARELGIISTERLCQRIADTMDGLALLPLWHGLPYAHYVLPDLTPSNDVSSADAGLLCACLLAVAQGLRDYLPETPDEHRALSGRVSDFAAAMELHQLYDPVARLFSLSWHGDTERLDPAHHRLYASEAQLLSFVAVMRREVPLSHFARLDRTQVRIGRDTPFVSQSGAAAEYLLPRLLLPTVPGTAMHRSIQAVIRAQRRAGVEGMFGVSESCFWGFDPQMTYRTQRFGLPETALGPCVSHPVIAPYAAALCLPFAQDAATDSLARLRSRGMLGRLGYFDSLDFDPDHLPKGTAEAMVQTHLTTHQGMLLCSLCNALTGNILVRHFAAIPEAAAMTALLREKPIRRLTLPPKAIHPEITHPHEPPFHRIAVPMQLPVEAQVVGSPEAVLAVSAQGSCLMRSRGVDLTAFLGDPTRQEGIQFHLSDGLTAYRLTDPTLPGETVFAEGHARFTRQCGPLQVTLTAFADPVQAAFLHLIEVSNLSARERTFELMSRLPLAFPAEVSHPEERVLMASGAHRLCHALSTHEPLLALAPGDGLSFRARLRIGSRGRAAVIFVTRLMAPGEAFSLEALSPRLSEADSLITLARLQSRTITGSLGISQVQAAEFSRLFGPLLWQGQPHQGPLTPLTQPLEALDIPAHLPLLLLIIHDGACAGLVQETATAVHWLHLMGMEVRLCILCEGSEAAAALAQAHTTLGTDPATLLLSASLPEGTRDTLEAHARLILYQGAGSITAQVKALAQQLPDILLPEDDSAPPPLENEELLFPSGHSGFQRGTEDYVIRLIPGENNPWQGQVADGPILTRCTADGPRETTLDGMPLIHSETAYLHSNRTAFPLMDPALTRRIQVSPGVTTWRCLGHGLDCTLQAAVIPGTTLGCRMLRIRSKAKEEVRLTLTIAVRFATPLAYLTPTEGGFTAASPAMEALGCLALAEGRCTARVVNAAAFTGFGSLPDFHAPDCETGSMGLFTLPVTLAPGGSESFAWLLGACTQVEEIEQQLAAIRRGGISPVFREVRQMWSQRLNALHVSTPEPYLDLLMNRILPWEARLMHHPLRAVPALLYTEPQQARDALLASHDASLLLPFTAAWYLDRTAGDPLLQDRCMEILKGHQLGDHGLPLEDGEESLPLALRYACTLHAYARHCDPQTAQEMEDLRAHLLESVDRTCWTGGWYGQALDAPTQALAVLAFGATDRTLQAMETVCQRMLKPPRHAALLLLALCELDWADRAWQLLSICDIREDPGWLYAIVLEKLLGLQMRGGQFRLRPMSPPDWDGLTISLQQGSATWRFHAEASESTPSGWAAPTDDGRIHEVRTPLRKPSTRGIIRAGSLASQG